MELRFKDFIEGTQAGLNAPGRAGQHFWKPETPITHDPMTHTLTPQGNKPIKGVHITSQLGPMQPASFKGLRAQDLGIKVKKVPKFKV